MYVMYYVLLIIIYESECGYQHKRLIKMCKAKVKVFPKKVVICAAVAVARVSVSCSNQNKHGDRAEDCLALDTEQRPSAQISPSLDTTVYSLVL